MSSRRHSHRASLIWTAAPQGEPRHAHRARPSGAAVGSGFDAEPSGRTHPLTDRSANARLHAYDQRVKGAFDRIVPVLKRIAQLRCAPDFVAQAQVVAEAELGFRMPEDRLEEAWIAGLDLRTLFAWSVFETYRRMADEFLIEDPLGGRETSSFEAFLQECGFHMLDVTPCADGRLAHAISYVLRLPFGAVRRKSYAGGLFDVEDAVSKWVEIEYRRFREGRPNTADAPTRYLKAVIYHFSSRDPAHQGCAAHGSDDARAARAALDRLLAFRQAIENSFCCGASVALLLIGLDTDTDGIRIHVPNAAGEVALDRTIDAAQVYDITCDLAPDAARARVLELVRRAAPGGASDDGKTQLIARLIENNLSQIDYVRALHDGGYGDHGHAERFMGVGVGFDEIQLRNLTYFAYLDTVEEGAADLDVGCMIFSGLNVSRGLPIPVVIRFDYRGAVPGARERAVLHCQRLDRALIERFERQAGAGLLHRLLAIRDTDAGTGLEIVGSSLQRDGIGGL